MKTDRQSFINEIHRRLVIEYGERSISSRKHPLDELIFTIPSQHTSDLNRDRAWAGLRKDNMPWSDIAALPARDIEMKIKPGGLARQKARRILTILNKIRQDHGSLDLDFLRELNDEQITRYLIAFPGVGPKTVSCVLLFSMDRPAFPVDTHIHRLATRLGLIPRGTSASKAHQILGQQAPADIYLTFHMNLISHGRKICRAKSPSCSACSLDAICPKNI